MPLRPASLLAILLLLGAACDAPSGAADAASGAAGDAAGAGPSVDAGEDQAVGHEVGEDAAEVAAEDTAADAVGDAPAPTGPVLDVSPAALAFGPRQAHRTARASLTLSSRGSAPVTVTEVAFTAGSSARFAVVSAPTAATPLVVAPDDSAILEVTYTPDGFSDVDEVTGEPLLDHGTLLLRHDAAGGATEVAVTGWAVSCSGPIAVITVEEGEDVVPGTTLHLRGDQSYAFAGRVMRWEWSVLAPAGGGGLFLPAPTFPNPTFTVEGAGVYEFSLDVWDEEGGRCCEPARYEVVATPDAALHAELLWTTAGDPDESDPSGPQSAEVDLHLVHPAAPADPTAPDHDGDGAPDPYFDPRWDCWAGNPSPDWGAPGGEGDPRCFGADGPSGEAVTLEEPDAGSTYRLAVHVRDDHGLGPVGATLRVYRFGSLVFAAEDVTLAAGDLWFAAAVDWPSGRVEACRRPEGEAWITPDYPLPAESNP